MLQVKFWKWKIWNKEVITTKIIVVVNWFIPVKVFSIHIKQSFLICNTFEAAYEDLVIMTGWFIKQLTLISKKYFLFLYPKIVNSSKKGSYHIVNSGHILNFFLDSFVFLKKVPQQLANAKDFAKAHLYFYNICHGKKNAEAIEFLKPLKKYFS